LIERRPCFDAIFFHETVKSFVRCRHTLPHLVCCCSIFAPNALIIPSFKGSVLFLDKRQVLISSLTGIAGKIGTETFLLSNRIRENNSLSVLEELNVDEISPLRG
jgi:hypothetical protein